MRLVARMNSQGAFFSASVRHAFGDVELHRFVDTLYVDGPEVLRRSPFRKKITSLQDFERIYSGNLLVHEISGSSFRAILPSHLIATMLELLQLKLGMRILVIGDHSGYIAALVSVIVGFQECVTVVPAIGDGWSKVRRRLDAAGYGKVTVLDSDGFFGAEAAAPFDRILLSVGCPDISEYWMGQLMPTGFVIVPLYHGGWFPIVKCWPEKRSTRGKIVGSAGTMVPGMEGELDGRILPPVITTPNVETVQVPLWAEMKADRLRDFWYYVCLCSTNTCVLHIVQDDKVLARGFGLFSSNSSWVMIVSKKHVIRGDKAMISALDRYYRQWVELRRPRLAAYEIEFFSTFDFESIASWNIMRPLHRQLVNLPLANYD